MTGRTRGGLAALALTLGLAAPARAGSIFHHDDGPDCPRPSYSCLHYLTPSYYLYRAHHTDHPEYLYAQVPCPGMASYESFAVPCPTADPAALAKYALRHSCIGSTYQAAPPAAKDEKGAAPGGADAPAPKPEKLPAPKPAR